MEELIECGTASMKSLRDLMGKLPDLERGLCSIFHQKVKLADYSCSIFRMKIIDRIDLCNGFHFLSFLKYGQLIKIKSP